MFSCWGQRLYCGCILHRLLPGLSTSLVYLLHFVSTAANADVQIQSAPQFGGHKQGFQTVVDPSLVNPNFYLLWIVVMTKLNVVLFQALPLHLLARVERNIYCFLWLSRWWHPSSKGVLMASGDLVAPGTSGFHINSGKFLVFREKNQYLARIQPTNST